MSTATICPSPTPTDQGPKTPTLATLDGNEAVARVAYALTDMSVIYPITPSSPMGEFADAWAAKGNPNLWGQVPTISQMQSEGGAAGAVHGALQAGSLATTYTASQGLLLMLPNFFKIAGEMLPFVAHVAARTIATHALSIFGDHSDVMAARMTGMAMLCSNSVQEAHDLAAISHAATLKTRLPFMHFFDGFRTSHEVAKIKLIDDDVLRALIDDDDILAFRGRALNPNRPVVRGTAQNPDVFFQCREAANPYYIDAPIIIENVMKEFESLTGRRYRLFEYEGHPEAESVVIVMGSGAETCAQTALHLAELGEKVGVLKVRLYRPFSRRHFFKFLPASVKNIAVLDRTKEPGAPAEPLFLDVQAALAERKEYHNATIIGGRFGLSSKEFTPGMAKAVFDELHQQTPKRGFTVGIVDDVTHTSLEWDENFHVETDRVLKAVFYGLGSDGTVGANKNTIKIIGEQTDNHAQGYFVYDSKKSGAMTTSHLRFGPDPIRSPYLIGDNQADFVGSHQFVFLDRIDTLQTAKPGATMLINTPYAPDQVWDKLNRETQEALIAKKIKLYTIDAMKVARQAGMGSRINTIMQTCFFAISGVLPRDQAIGKIKNAIQKTYGVKGQKIVELNFKAVDMTLEHLYEVPTPAPGSQQESDLSTKTRPPMVPTGAPDFVQRVTAQIMAGHGDKLPVSAFPIDGTWPTHTTRWEKRGIADEIPVWDPEVCIQCNKCAIVCPHAAIRVKAYDPRKDGEPANFLSMDYKAKDLRGLKYTVQVAPDDCTGCQVCVMACPAKNKAEPKKKAINMVNRLDVLDEERQRFDHFETIPPLPGEKIVRLDVKSSQFLEPLFEYSGACAGCGETSYIKLVTQLFGDRMIVANATGCSSIYGGNLPTTPYAQDGCGRGPAWANSLFEDNAEFGYGMRLAVDQQTNQAQRLLMAYQDVVGEDVATALLQDNGAGFDPAGIRAKRQALQTALAKLKTVNEPDARQLVSLLDNLVAKSIWLFGGDGWAYDIGFGGLDHVLSQDLDINVLVLDTEVYSNTGGQASKATPLGASAKFATAGKNIHKKDLGMLAMSYGHVYVASVAMGANDNQAVKAISEAASYPGPSLIIAYSPCIAHGYDMKNSLTQQKLAVQSGVWPLFRFDPRRVAEGKPPLQLDAKPTGKVKAREYMANETRFRMVQKMSPDRFDLLTGEADRLAEQRIELYKQLATIRTSIPCEEDEVIEASTPA